jgi:hypothetical protein
MSLPAANPTDLPHLSSSRTTASRPATAVASVDLVEESSATRRDLPLSRASLARTPDEGFALERVCRYVSRLCSGTASGLFMRPAAARSSASAAPPCGLRFPSKSCSERPSKRFLRSLRKCRPSALGSMAHSLNGAPTKIGRFNKRRQSCTRTK